MKTYSCIFLLLISLAYGCKINKGVTTTTQTINGNEILIKTTGNSGNSSNLSGRVTLIGTAADIEANKNISLPYANIQLTKDGKSFNLAADIARGNFGIENIAPGQYALSISYPSCKALETSITIKKASNINIEAKILVAPLVEEKPKTNPNDIIIVDNAEIKRTINGSEIFIKPTAISGDSSTLSGNIKDKEFNEQIIAASIILTKDGKIFSQITDEEGNFKIEKIPNGQYFLQMDCVGYKSFRTSFTIVQASNISIEVKVAESSVIQEKPVIYFYPTKKEDISVVLNYDGKLLHTYPAYPENGWKVRAEPNGTLWDEKGQEYYALFWEGRPKTELAAKDGFIVAGNQTAAFLEEKLAYLGLNRREANEFIMYWLPRMENNAYNLIHFAGADYEKSAELKITPQPETSIRIMMLTQGLQTKVDFPLQDLSPLKKTRKGFTVVEWGGTVVNSINEGM